MTRVGSVFHKLWKIRWQHFFPLLTIVASIFFVFFVLSAMSLYPGGSSLRHDSIGFDLTRNYFCDLLLATTYNGQANPGKHYGVMAFVTFAILLFAFFNSLSGTMIASRKKRVSIKILGSLSSALIIVTMLASFETYPLLHRIAILLGGLFGIMAIGPSILALIKSGGVPRWYRYCGFFALSTAGLLLMSFAVLALGWIPETSLFITIQKFSIASFLVVMTYGAWKLAKSSFLSSLA